MCSFRADTPVAADVCPSPNHGERRGGRAPSMLMLHYTGMPTAQGALDWLCDPRSQVSCHYFVHEDGRVVQLVSEARRAWHAGAGIWRGETDINSASIGIEIANPGHDSGCPPFPDAQVDGVIALCRDILARQPIPPGNVIAHSDAAPRRKRDPGERFPWQRLAAAGIGLWVPPAPIVPGPALGPGDAGPEVTALQAALRRCGYGLATGDCYDEETAIVVAAFQRRHRPGLVDGIADPSSRATLAALLQAIEAGGGA